MPKDQRRRQLKLLKKRRKQKAKKKRDRQATGEAARIERIIRNARSYPIHECVINPGWDEGGIAHIALARRQPNGLIVFGVYLVDLYCLGLKNTFCDASVSSLTYNDEIRGSLSPGEPPTKCPVSLAHEIIYGAIDYAAAIGFEPHKDFKLSQHVLEDRSRLKMTHQVEFGYDGKPLFISGPHDDVDRILTHLEHTLGEGNFNFMIGGPVGSDDTGDDSCYDDEMFVDEDSEEYV